MKLGKVCAVSHKSKRRCARVARRAAQMPRGNPISAAKITEMHTDTMTGATRLLRSFGLISAETARTWRKQQMDIKAGVDEMIELANQRALSSKTFAGRNRLGQDGATKPGVDAAATVIDIGPLQKQLDAVIQKRRDFAARDGGSTGVFSAGGAATKGSQEAFRGIVESARNQERQLKLDSDRNKLLEEQLNIEKQIKDALDKANEVPEGVEFEIATLYN